MNELYRTNTRRGGLVLYIYIKYKTYKIYIENLNRGKESWKKQ